MTILANQTIARSGKYTRPTAKFAKTSSSGLESTPIANLDVILAYASTVPVTVHYAVTSASALEGFDYTIDSGPLVFQPGETTKPIVLHIVDDALNEANETVKVSLVAADQASITASAYHIYTITDNDPIPTVQFRRANSNCLEAYSPANIEVYLSAPTGRSVTLNYGPTGGTATGGGVDYTLAAGKLTFSVGPDGATRTSLPIPVAITKDSVVDPDETVIVGLSSPTYATLGPIASHTMTIAEMASGPTAQFTIGSSPESVAVVTMMVSLTHPYPQAVSIPYAATGGSAAYGVDYALPAGNLEIPAGDTYGVITMQVIDDNLVEANESVTVTLYPPEGVALAMPSTFTYTILDDDAERPTVGFKLSSTNGLENVSPANLEVRLSKPAGQTITVAYTVTGGSATGGGVDYTLANGTLSFSAGTISKFISPAIVNDTLVEPDETIQVTLSSPSGATLGPIISHSYTIQNND